MGINKNLDKIIFSQKTIFIGLAILLFFAGLVSILLRYTKNNGQKIPGLNYPQNASSSNQTGNNAENPGPSSAAKFNPPISRWDSRVTKKPFGIYVTPNDSPVSPERFKGYHTGVDFETFSDEQNAEVPINAICSGQLLVKEYASGYGGLTVQACNFEGPITVIYGHLKLSSISVKVGEQIAAGEKIGILGKGYSVETDGERKHLHLGIHKGSAVNILGYVQNPAELANWLDILNYLK